MYNSLISVIIPVYNGEKFIKEAINSVINQSHKDLEVIVVDDGSTDNTKNIVNNIQDERIKYIYKENGGTASARNKGIKESSGVLIAFLDADDFWLKNKLEEQLDLLCKDKKVGLVYSDMEFFGTDFKYKTYFEMTGGSRKGWVLKDLIKKNFVAMPSVIIKREVINNVGVFNDKLRYGEDYDFWIRIATKYKFDASGNILVRYRRHEGQLTNKSKDGYVFLVNFYKSLLKNKKLKEYRFLIIIKILESKTKYLLFIIKSIFK